LTYFGKQGKVVAFDVHMPVNKAVILSEVSRGADAGKLSKVTNQVRLVEVPAFHGDIGPIGRFLLLVDGRSRPLKSLHAAKQLGRHTYFRFEDLNKSALAETYLL
jgi:hypothetical protein